MKKLWIKSRIFLTFFVFIIVFVNFFSYWLYKLVTDKFIDNVVWNINSEYQTITNFIDLQKDSIFVLPEYEMKNINSMWFFFYLWKNDEKLINNYKLWVNYYDDNKNIIFRWDYRWYNIVIWKNIEDLNKIKKGFIDIVIFLNIFSLFLILIITYYLTSSLLKPLYDISNFIKKYDLSKDKKLIKNDYWNSEIGQYIESTNNFLNKVNNIFNSQKDFIQDVSHELKTPLMQIESSIEMLEWKINDDKILSKLENIKLSVKNINSIVSNLSFLLRWEEKFTTKDKIDLEKYFIERLEFYNNEAKIKNINIILKVNFPLEIINNVYYLDRLFDNIIFNAIYYNNWNNDLIIEINKNFIKIIDKWIWIKKEDLDKIFNRFYRNDNSNIFNPYWNWLWLSIVKKITNMFGWKIEISSKIWEGSEFKIFFQK